MHECGKETKLYLRNAALIQAMERGLKKQKICLAASAGGHLTEIMQLKPFLKAHPYYIVSDSRFNAVNLEGREKMHYVSVPRRNPFALLANMWQSLGIFLKENPAVVISTGADVAFFTCVLAKLFRKKLIFIETFTRSSQPSLTGKLLYPLCDLFFIQWKELKKYYPRAIYAGSLV